MDTRIQFRIDEETKHLAQLMAESQGQTLSDACRKLIEKLAEEQRKTMAHDTWLTQQIDTAFKKLDSGEAVFITDEVNMEARKAKIRNRDQA